MVPYPDISPTIFQIGPVQVRWYGMMYLISFIIGYFLIKAFADKRGLKLRKEGILDLLTYAAIGLIAGGRLGYILFYNLSYYLDYPQRVFYVWQGGLSFHGGLIGIILGSLIFSRKRGIPFMDLADTAIIAAPVGLGLGRIGNFINRELFGRVTEVPWCMVFPGGGPECRHPSQLYESLLEGWVTFGILLYFSRKAYPRGFLFWTFITCYGFFRFFVEFFREPDPQLGFVFGPFTMGQCLSAPMALLGLIFTFRALRSNNLPKVQA